MKTIAILALSILALAGAIGLGFRLGRRARRGRGRPGGKVRASDRDIVL